MKKVSIIMAVIAAVATLTTSALAEGDAIQLDGFTFNRNTETWYCVNGKYIDFNSNGIYTDTLVTNIEGGSANLMPIRAFAESIGATLSPGNGQGVWDVIADEYAINLCAGYDFINVYKMNNGQGEFLATWKLNCPVVEHEGVTYIPFRSAICALFGVDESETATTDKIAVNMFDTGYAIFANVNGNAEADKKEKSELTREVKIFDETIDIEKEVDEANFKKYLDSKLKDVEKCYYVVNGEISLNEVENLNDLDAVVTDEDIKTVQVGTFDYIKTTYVSKTVLKTAEIDSEKYYFGKEIADGPLAGNIDYSYTKDDEYTHIIDKNAKFGTIVCDGKEHKFVVKRISAATQTNPDATAEVCPAKLNGASVSLKDGTKLDKEGKQVVEEVKEEVTEEVAEEVAEEATEEVTEEVTGE